ncbi:MAG: transcription termination/antitermination factor NusG [Candidatus Chisholmbacteria bacterium]|nr:transcription termination/antitermination factor NusG [Candidatus Chisholmbacteria bacterium]
MPDILKTETPPSKPTKKASAKGGKKSAEKKAKKAKTPYHLKISAAAPETAHWYIVHTYSGHELRAAETLKQRVKTMNLDGKIFEILIPTQEKIRIQKGKKDTIKEKIFPGYMLIKMIVDDDSWLAVRTTAGITSFVGIGSKPTPLPEAEVQTIMKFMEMAAPKHKATFTVGDSVKIVEGPFAEFIGSVDKIDEGKGKVSVLVSIFGRETPVELDFLQVTKI